MNESDSKPNKFVKTNKNWTYEEKIKLIKLVEKFPVLWDTTSEIYRQSYKRKLAFEAIKLELNNKFTCKKFFN